jgi:cytoskeletal protein RodZ
MYEELRGNMFEEENQSSIEQMQAGSISVFIVIIALAIVGLLGLLWMMKS